MAGLEDKVLERLDKWYFDRIKRNYDFVLETRTLSFLAPELGYKPRQSPKEVLYTLAGLSKDVFMETHKQYFSLNLKAARLSLNLIPLESAPGEVLPYFKPLLESMNGITLFIEEACRITDGRSPEQLTDNEIDSAFFKIYKSPSDFAEKLTQLMDTPYILDALLEKQGLGDGKKPNVQQIKCIEAVKKWMPHLMNGIFKDIYFDKLPDSDYWTGNDVGNVVYYIRFDYQKKAALITGVENEYDINNPRYIFNNPQVLNWPLASDWLGDINDSSKLILDKKGKKNSPEEVKKPGDWYIVERVDIAAIKPKEIRKVE